jgi:hypothetical protein
MVVSTTRYNQIRETTAGRNREVKRAEDGVVCPSNLTHGHARPWTPDPNGQGMGRNLHPWVSPMDDPISYR